MEKYTEASIQFALQTELDSRGQQFILPNVMVDWGEADLISVTAAGYMQEWEIKVSKSDFYADFKKGKHRWLARPGYTPGGQCTASCFWYVMPDGLVPDLEVPDYAGHVAMVGGTVVIKRRAPMLHRRKLGDYQYDWLLRIAAMKLWSVKRDLRYARQHAAHAY